MGLDPDPLLAFKKSGYADRRVEIDLRTGGSRSVKLPRASHRPAGTSAGTPSSTPVKTEPAGTGPGRQKGEPVDPFGKPKS